MALRLWKCYNPKCSDEPGGAIGHDFTNETGKCDKCGTDPKHESCGHIITERVIVHFDPPSGIVDGIGKRRLSCDGQKIGQRRASGHWKAVNCPTCQTTQDFADAKRLDSAEVHPDFAIQLAGDAKRGALDLVAIGTKSGGCG